MDDDTCVTSSITMNFFFAEHHLFREWLQHRYGVFPEHGFSGDDRYPDFYDFGARGKVANDACNNDNNNNNDSVTVRGIQKKSWALFLFSFSLPLLLSLSPGGRRINQY